MYVLPRGQQKDMTMFSSIQKTGNGLETFLGENELYCDCFELAGYPDELMLVLKMNSRLFYFYPNNNIGPQAPTCFT